MLKVDLLGTKELRAAIEKAEKKLVEGVDRQMTDATWRINGMQKSLTPVDKGALRAGNQVKVDQPLTKVLYNDIEYAPYQEFGTGGFVFLGETWMTPELMASAEVFKGTGARKINMKPQPFFFRPFFEEQPRLIKAIEEILK
jgi:HK97 gp10 family phage protein